MRFVRFLVNSWELLILILTEILYTSWQNRQKEVGVEIVVMDDGWFGREMTIIPDLEVWFVNEKLGCSLGSLIEKINGIGMKFGIWVEPEMVSMDSDLYRAHRTGH